MKPGCLEHEFSWGAPSQIRNFSATNPPNWNLGGWLTVTIKIWETPCPQIRYPQIGHILDFNWASNQGPKTWGFKMPTWGVFFAQVERFYDILCASQNQKKQVSTSIGEHTALSTDRGIYFNWPCNSVKCFLCGHWFVHLLVRLSIHLSVYVSFVYLLPIRKGVHYPINYSNGSIHSHP